MYNVGQWNACLAHPIACTAGELNCREERWTNSSEVTSGLFQIVFKGLCLEGARAVRSLDLRREGSVQNFYNRCDALFNALEIDQVRRLPKHRMVCGYGSQSGAPEWPQCGFWAWLSSRSLVQVLMSSVLVAASLHFNRCHMQMSVAPFPLVACLHFLSSLQSLCFDTSWPFDCLALYAPTVCKASCRSALAKTHSL